MPTARPSIRARIGAVGLSSTKRGRGGCRASRADADSAVSIGSPAATSEPKVIASTTAPRGDTDSSPMPPAPLARRARRRRRTRPDIVRPAPLHAATPSGTRVGDVPRFLDPRTGRGDPAVGRDELGGERIQLPSGYVGAALPTLASAALTSPGASRNDPAARGEDDPRREHRRPAEPSASTERSPGRDRCPASTNVSSRSRPAQRAATDALATSEPRGQTDERIAGAAEGGPADRYRAGAMAIP